MPLTAWRMERYERGVVLLRDGAEVLAVAEEAGTLTVQLSDVVALFERRYAEPGVVHSIETGPAPEPKGEPPEPVAVPQDRVAAWQQWRKGEHG